tara:strand:+ start:58 stop:291 length:234 start_codon:yes stop_codon:yes gene_type:complete
VQKLFNVMAVASFVMSGGLVAASVVAFARIPEIIENYTADMIGNITGNVTEMIPTQIDQSMPELPTSTGPAVPFKIP